MFKAALLGTIVAIAGVIVTALVADAISGPLLVTSPGAEGPEALALGAAIAGTVAGGIAGLILAAIIGRFFAAKASTVFIGICVAGLVAYGAFSFSAAEQFSTGLWLNVMHVVAAIPIVGLLLQQLSGKTTNSPTSPRFART